MQFIVASRSCPVQNQSAFQWKRSEKAFKTVKYALVSKDKGAQTFHMLLIGEAGSRKTSFLNL